MMIHGWTGWIRESRSGKLLMSSVMGAAAALGFIICGASDVHARPRMAAALISQQARQPQYNDFLRLVFDNINPPPTKLGGPKAYRVFFGATVFYEPPIRISQIADFSGIPVKSSVSLFVIRCIPPEDSTAEPVLATWPNLISKILSDYDDNPPTPNSLDEAIQTIAESFSDVSSTIADEPLYNALGVGKQFFEEYPFDEEPPTFTATQMQGQMSSRFGTYAAFSGLGYAVEGTASGPALDAAQISRQMITPEYVLKNVTLSEAGCSCIEVPPYPGRDNQKLHPDFVLRAGGDGFCRTVRYVGPRGR
jgi:hypothetical protein